VAELRDPVVDGRLQRGPVGHVGHVRDHAAIELLDQGHRLVQVSRDAIGYGTLGTSAQRSTPMMSAPSSANRIAWLRPCPRATPVMKATLPSSRPAMSSS